MTISSHRLSYFAKLNSRVVFGPEPEDIRLRGTRCEKPVLPVPVSELHSNIYLVKCRMLGQGRDYKLHAPTAFKHQNGGLL